MNKELVVYTSYSQVMVHQKISVFFYPSELVPDLLGHYVIVCGKSVYETVVLSRVHKLQSGTKYIGTQQKFTNFVISTPVPPISILKSGKFWKKLGWGEGEGEGVWEKKFIKFLCLFHLFCPRLCGNLGV